MRAVLIGEAEEVGIDGLAQSANKAKFSSATRENGRFLIYRRGLHTSFASEIFKQWQNEDISLKGMEIWTPFTSKSCNALRMCLY